MNVSTFSDPLSASDVVYFIEFKLKQDELFSSSFAKVFLTLEMEKAVRSMWNEFIE